MSEMFVYFIKPVGMVGPIKIGCSEYPVSRLKTLASWSPFELEIVATAPGGYSLERNLHECFADISLRGEWFSPDARLLALVEAVVAGKEIGEAVDLNDRRGSIRKGRKFKAMSENTKLRMHYGFRISGQLRSWRKKLGGYRWAPRDVELIMDDWRGHWRDQDGSGIRPTPEQFARLDSFLANLPDGLLTNEQRFTSA